MDWPELYARICAQTGWTWEYVGEFLTLPRLAALNKYWGANPPLQQQVMGLLGGFGGGHPQAAEPQECGSLDDLLSDWTAMGGRMN